MGRKFGSDIGWAILDAVADGVEILQNAVYRPSALLRYGLADLKTLDILRARQRMKQAAMRLRRKGYLRALRIDGRRAFGLTKLGEKLRKTRDASLPPRYADGWATIVSFDIPERHSRLRQAFRRGLRDIGFRRKHLSVWVSDRDWTGELKQHIQRLDIHDWVVVIQGRIVSK